MPTQPSPPTFPLKNPCVVYAKVKASRVWEAKCDCLNQRNGNIVCGHARIFLGRRTRFVQNTCVEVYMKTENSDREWFYLHPSCP